MPSTSPATARRSLDLLIKGGQLIDGTGRPAVEVDVGVRGERLVLVHDPENVDADRVIDATGLVVAPGFIDMHAHSGLMMLANPRHEPKVQQGVTTELIGVDGNSYAPFTSKQRLLEFVDINAGLDGRPDLAYDWQTVTEYLELFGTSAVNVGMLIGNSALRLCTVGWNDRPATDRELADMVAMLREGIQHGAFGLSTGLDYPPSEFASTEELIALCQVTSDLGGIYHTHVRNRLGDRVLDPIREALVIGKKSGTPAHITHFYKRGWAQSGATDLIGLLDEAHAAGEDVSFDTYPYLYGSSRLLIVLPTWTHTEGPAGLLQILQDKDGRERLRKEVGPRAVSWDEMWLTGFSRPENKGLEGRTVAAIAASRGQDPVDTVCDLLVQENLGLSYVALADTGFTRWKFLSHPLATVGSDGLLLGDFPSPRTYGTFPYMLQSCVREERLLSLEEAVHKLTGLPAKRLGITDRGIIEDGAYADVVLFDPERVGSPATRREPTVAPTGIHYVFVNGVIVVEEGRHTGQLPGRAIHA